MRLRSEAIRRFAGHSSITVTEKYMHLAPTAYANQILRAMDRATKHR